MNNSTNTLYHSLELGLIALSVIFTFLVFAFPSIGLLYTNAQLWIYVAILVVNYLDDKRFNLYQVWIAAYIFMVWAEMRILIDMDPQLFVYLKPFVRFNLANACVMIGYHSNHKKTLKNNTLWVEKEGTKYFIIIILLLEAYYVYSTMSIVQSVMSGSRGSGSATGTGSLGGSLTNALGLILPGFVAYYYKYIRKKNVLFALLVASPVLIMLFLRSTRYKFLFSVLPILVIYDILNLKNHDLKKNLLLILSVLLIMGSSSFIRDNRSKSFDEWGNFQLFNYDNSSVSNDPFTLKIASEMSPEGVVRMAEIADEYFESNHLHYGRETAFILYFWVPRKIWPSKPTMLDNWLIREYENVAEGYSSASGFIGELRADFGWGCLLFMLLFGCFLKRLDNYCDFVFRSGSHSFDMILVACLFPWVFFFVRSPITSTMSLLWELVLYFIMRKLFANKNQIVSNYE